MPLGKTDLYLYDKTIIKNDTNADEASLRAFDEEMKSEEWDVTISNAITGKSVFESHIEGANVEIDASEWASGIYVVNASIGKKTLTKKFAVK